MKITPKKVLKKTIPRLNRLVEERDKLKHEANHWKSYAKVQEAWAPRGHFYSPYADLDYIQKNEDRIFSSEKREFPGIDLHESQQVELLKELAQYYKGLPFPEEKSEAMRYYYKNFAYSYTDGIVLHSMIRHLKPKRIIEIGSGFSSCMTLDTNELFFDNKIEVTFIEPYPELLLSLVKPQEKERINLVEEKLELLDLSIVDQLQEGDILFVDSTHVSKVNSDVNFIFFEIMPRLNKGVHIHVHDVFYPFEYPKEWVYEGRAWTEDYILRAFLQFNDHFEITFWANYLHLFYSDIFEKEMPLTLKNKGGNFWMKKVK